MINDPMSFIQMAYDPALVAEVSHDSILVHQMLYDPALAPQVRAVMLPMHRVGPESKLFLIRLVFIYGATAFNGDTRRLGRDFALTDAVVDRGFRELVIAGVLRKSKYHSGGKGRPRNRYQLTEEFLAKRLPRSAYGFKNFYLILNLVCGNGTTAHVIQTKEVMRFRAILNFISNNRRFRFNWVQHKTAHYNVRRKNLVMPWPMPSESSNSLSKMKASMRLLLAVLIVCADGVGVVQGMSIKQLMDLTGMTKKRLMQHLAVLVKQGYIRRFVPDYMGINSPFKDRTGICLLNLCHAQFYDACTPQIGLVAVMSRERSITVNFDEPVFNGLDQSTKQYVSRILQLSVPLPEPEPNSREDRLLISRMSSYINTEHDYLKKKIVTQAQSPAALRLFGQLNEGLVQFLLLKLDQIAFELMRQRKSYHLRFEPDYVRFCEKFMGAWDQKFTQGYADIGELIWALAELKAWRYMNFIKASGRLEDISVFNTCVSSGLEPLEKYRMGFIVTKHSGYKLAVDLPIHFQAPPPNSGWQRLTDPKQIEQVKRDYGFVTKSGLTDEETRKLYSTFMDW